MFSAMESETADEVPDADEQWCNTPTYSVSTRRKWPLLTITMWIQAFGANRANPTLCKGISIRSAKWRPDRLNVFNGKYCIEGCRKLAVVVMDQESLSGEIVLETPCELPCLLGNPSRVGVLSTTGKINTPSIQLYEEQNVNRFKNTVSTVKKSQASICDW